MASPASLMLGTDGFKSDSSAYDELVNSTNYLIESMNCFLCNHSFGEGDQPFLIFEKRIRNDGQLECALSAVLSSALGQDVMEEKVHSTLLCESCNTTVLEFENLEQRFCEIRYRILRTYNRTAHKNDLKPIVFEINGVIQDDIFSLDGSENECKTNRQDELLVSKNEMDEIAGEAIIFPRSELVSYADVDLVEEVDDEEEDRNEYGSVMMDMTQTDIHIKDDFATELDFSDNQDEIIVFNDMLDQNSQTSASDGFMINSQRSQSTIEAFNGSSGAVSIVYDNVDGLSSDIPLYKLQGSRYCCLVCKLAPPHLDGKSFTEHMRSAHRISFYVCDLCSSAFARSEELDTHLKSQHCVASKYVCEICQRVFTNYRLFRLHKRCHYGGGKQNQCSECHKKFTSKNLLSEHMNMHTGERPYKCHKCPKDFASKYTLHAHIKIHTERKRPFKCDDCNKAFLNQQNLTQHKKLHVSTKSHICDVCNKAFSTQHNLDVHKIVHSGQRPFICRTCGKSFARRADVKDHERTHTGERPFKCDLCPQAFAQRSNLTSHKKSTHFNEKLHKCTECHRSFKRRRLLDYHIQAAHTGERPYKCELCAAAFVYPEHYKKHMIIHSGQKPYACEVCGKTFNSSDNRKAHRFVHSDKKPYECLECGAGFMRKPLLLAHMRQMQHLNDKIIVNQPQVAENISVALNDEEATAMDGGEEVTEANESLNNIMQCVENVPNGEEDNDDVIITVNNKQQVKGDLSSVKYLEFDLDGNCQEKFTWEHMDNGVDKD